MRRALGVALVVLGALLVGAALMAGALRATAGPAPRPATAAELRHQLQVERTRHNRTERRGVDHAIALAATAFGVSERDMRAVARCESGLRATARNPSSASGVFQFLDSTWSRYPFRRFSAFDPYANALAAGYVVSRDGGWHQWSCRP